MYQMLNKKTITQQKITYITVNNSKTLSGIPVLSILFLHPYYSSELRSRDHFSKLPIGFLVASSRNMSKYPTVKFYVIFSIF